jgi:hypothetical protein
VFSNSTSEKQVAKSLRAGPKGSTWQIDGGAAPTTIAASITCFN